MDDPVIRMPNDGELPTRRVDLAYLSVLPDTLEKARGQDEPLTLERVVAQIIRAIRVIRPSLSERELNSDTNLAFDLGFESAIRVELLLEVQRALDVDLNVGVAVMFAEITVAELAELIVKLEDRNPDQFT